MSFQIPSLSFLTTEARLWLFWEEGWVGNAKGAITCSVHVFPNHFVPSFSGIVKILHMSSAPQRLQGLEAWVSAGTPKPLQELFFVAGLIQDP